MNLHRSGTRPDWADIPPQQQSFLQRLAARTNGVLTLPNVISCTGLALVVVGLYLIADARTIEGFIALVIGRLLDLVDGIVAEATHTKGPVGEFVDVCVDKITTVLTIVVFFIIAIAPAWLIALLLVPQLIILATTLYATTARRRLHPSVAGKYSMALSWVGLAALLLYRITDELPVLYIIAVVAILLSVVLSGVAVRYYLKPR